MARKVARQLRDERQKEFVHALDQACKRHNRWTVWADFVVMAAISISNTVDKSNAEAREKTYMALASKYDKQELECICRMFAEVVSGIDENPDQDFLGELFMGLELGNDHNGQFFTPYNVCKMTAKMTYGKDLEEKIEQRGWVSVNDPACGAGALLVAFANECKLQNVNYQTSVLFVAQDIDYIVGCMCYIQLSLLGCPGYVVIADSISSPCTGFDSNPWYLSLEKTSGTPPCTSGTCGTTADCGGRLTGWSALAPGRSSPRTRGRRRSRRKHRQSAPRNLQLNP